jgi:preprotein translocase subunit SecA
MNILNKIFGSSNSRKLKKMNKIVTAINVFEQELEHLSDEQLSGKTGEFAQRLEAGSTLNSILPEAFAVVREASKRTLGLRHFDVQMIGGMSLHDGKIADCGVNHD